MTGRPTIECGHCRGHGRIPLPKPHWDTLLIVAERGPISTCEIARMGEIELLERVRPGGFVWRVKRAGE